MTHPVKNFVDNWGGSIGIATSVGGLYYTRETCRKTAKENLTNKLNGRRASFTLLSEDKINPLGYATLEKENGASDKQICHDIAQWRDLKLQQCSGKEARRLNRYKGIESNVEIGYEKSCDGRFICFVDRKTNKPMDLGRVAGNLRISSGGGCIVNGTSRLSAFPPGHHLYGFISNAELDHIYFMREDLVCTQMLIDVKGYHQGRFGRANAPSSIVLLAFLLIGIVWGVVRAFFRPKIFKKHS